MKGYKSHSGRNLVLWLCSPCSNFVLVDVNLVESLWIELQGLPKSLPNTEWMLYYKSNEDNSSIHSSFQAL